MVNTSDSGSRGQGFEPHSGRSVVSLSKSTGNTQEAVALSQHDGKIIYRDVKHQTKKIYIYIYSMHIITLGPWNKTLMSAKKYYGQTCSLLYESSFESYYLWYG